jgi:hypothetical protein
MHKLRVPRRSLSQSYYDLDAPGGQYAAFNMSKESSTVTYAFQGFNRTLSYLTSTSIQHIQSRGATPWSRICCGRLKCLMFHRSHPYSLTPGRVQEFESDRVLNTGGMDPELRLALDRLDHLTVTRP